MNRPVSGRGTGGKGEHSRGYGRAYQGALEAAMAIVVAVGLGILADHWLETSPTFLLVGVGLGFGAFVLRLVRLLRELTPTDGEDETRD